MNVKSISQRVFWLGRPIRIYNYALKDIKENKRVLIRKNCEKTKKN